LWTKHRNYWKRRQPLVVIWISIASWIMKNLYNLLKCCVKKVVLFYSAALVSFTLSWMTKKISLLISLFSVETIFLGFGLYLCRCARVSTSNRREVILISIAIYNETFISRVFYITRFVISSCYHYRVTLHVHNNVVTSRYSYRVTLH